VGEARSLPNLVENVLALLANKDWAGKAFHEQRHSSFLGPFVEYKEKVL